MTTETEGAAPEVDAEDTAAVLAAANPTEAKASEAPAAEDAQGSQSEPAPAGEAEDAKPKPTVQQRIDELTWRAKEAERREGEARAELAKAKTPASEAQPKPEDGDGRPDPGQFEFGVTDEGYIEALAEWKADQKVNQRFAERDARSDVVQTIESFKTRAAEAFPDGEPEGLKAYRALETVPVVLQDLVLKTAAGPTLAEHYGANPDALKALLDMPTHLQAFEIGQVQARLSASATAAPKKTASDAPDPPAHQGRGAGGKFQVDPATDDFAAFEKAYTKN